MFSKFECDTDLHILKYIEAVWNPLTMGLFTGFSIISGIETIFFLLRMVSSFKITRNLMKMTPKLYTSVLSCTMVYLYFSYKK